MRRASLGVGSRGGWIAETFTILLVMGLIAAVVMQGETLRPLLQGTALGRFLPLT